MSSERFWRLTAAIVLGVAGAIGLCYLLVRLYPVLVIFAAGFMIAYLLDPLLDRLQRRGWSRLQAVATVGLLLAAVVMVVSSLVVPLLVQQVGALARNWSQYSSGFEQIYQATKGTVSDYVQRYFPEAQVLPFLDAKVAEAGAWATDNMPRILSWVGDRLVRSVSLLGLALIIAVVGMHFMLSIGPLRGQIAGLLPAQEGGEVVAVDKEINAMLGQYLRGIVVTCLLVGIATSTLLAIVGRILGSEYGLLIGVIAGVSYMVPWVGGTLSAAAAAFFGYFTADHHAVLTAVLGAGTVLVVNQVSDIVVLPRIVGRRVGLHPLLITFALLAGYQLWGIWGMVIATPLAATCKIVLCRWLPVYPVPAEVPPRRKSLTVDMGALLQRISAVLSPLTHKIQEAMTAPTSEKISPDQEATNNDDAAT